MFELSSTSRRSFVASTLALLPGACALAAVRGDEAMYVGGTITSVPEKTEGRLDLSGESALNFTSKKGTISIPYGKIESIEYGQKAGRRVGVALAISPLALFSKKRKHYVTIGFTDENGKKQGAVFEFAKATIRKALATLETHSGKKVEYESEEAKKHIGG
jgi:hypothetical protein